MVSDQQTFSPWEFMGQPPSPSRIYFDRCINSSKKCHLMKRLLGRPCPFSRCDFLTLTTAHGLHPFLWRLSLLINELGNHSRDIYKRYLMAKTKLLMGEHYLNQVNLCKNTRSRCTWNTLNIECKWWYSELHMGGGGGGYFTKVWVARFSTW